MRHTLMAVVIIPALFPAAAQAQIGATKAPVPYQQVLSTNPFGLLFNWYNVEYEHRIGEATTLGFSASHVPDGEFANAALLARWYPERVALDGFYLGARAGAYGIKTHTYQYSTPPPRPDVSRRRSCRASAWSSATTGCSVQNRTSPSVLGSASRACCEVATATTTTSCR